MDPLQLEETIHDLKKSKHEFCRTAYYEVLKYEDCVDESFIIEEKKLDNWITVRFNKEEANWNFNESNVSLYLLQQFVSNQFQINAFSLEYIDQNENNIEINDDNDLNTAIKCIQHQDETELEIFVTECIPRDLPLHRFTAKDICNTIKHWVYNDINHQKHISRTQDIFNNHSLSGRKLLLLLNKLSTDDLKRILKEEMLSFMTEKTLDIIFEHIIEWRTHNESNLLLIFFVNIFILLHKI
eukprot:376140_1